MPKKQEIRKDGRYQVSVSLGRDPETGKRVQKYFYGETQTIAKAKRSAWVEERKKGLAEEAKPLTVAKWADVWLKTYATGGYSLQESHKRNVDIITEKLGDKLLSEITPADIQAFAKLYQGKSKSFVDKLRNDTKNIFATAEDNKKITRSPCRNTSWKGKKAKKRRILEQWERSLITAHWDQHSAGIWAMIMLYAGLRPGEAFALKGKHISENSITVTDGAHFEKNTLVVTEGVTKSEAGQREIPIEPELREMLRRISVADGEFICKSANGGPITKSACRKGWNTFQSILKCIKTEAGQWDKERSCFRGFRVDKLPEDKKAQWDAVLPIEQYSLRHDYCSRLYDKGTDIMTMKYLMGHESLEVTLKVYTHLTNRKKQQTINKLLGNPANRRTRPALKGGLHVKLHVRKPRSPANTAH